jgi:hypothetical protein
MKRETTSVNLKNSILTGVLIFLVSCEGIFQNPLNDRETGEKINLLIVDFNFFRTHVTCRIFDANKLTMIEAPVTITFTGKNGNDIVTFTGNKKASFSVTKGQIELTVDPAVKITEQNPFDFAIKAEAKGFLPMFKRINLLSEGKKSIDIYMVRETDLGETDIKGKIDFSEGDTTIVFGFSERIPFKSANTQDKPFTLNYSMSLADFLKLKDPAGNLLFSSSAEFLNAYNQNPEGFLSIRTTATSDYPSWIDYLFVEGDLKNVVLHILESGNVESITVNGTPVTNLNGGVLKASVAYTMSPVPDFFGFSVFENDRWNLTGTQISMGILPHPYTIVEAFDETFCSLGATIRFESSFPSSFSVTADVYDMNDRFLFTQKFTGKFPQSFVLENTPPIPVRFVFRDDNPGFTPLSELTIENLCSGEYTVNVVPSTGYKGYQCVLKAFCPDNPAVAVAPTYNGEYRLKNTNDPWQGAAMSGGVVDLLGLPEREYEYRIIWENEWEVMSFFTTFNTDGSYAYPSSSSITSGKMSDGRIRVNISHTYKQSVCDTMNW